MKPEIMIAEGVSLSDIRPRNGNKYSPNLHAFMQKRLRDCEASTWMVATSDDGYLCLVWEWLDEHGKHRDYVSTLLMGVLCNGAKAQTSIVLNRTFTFHPDFWQTYKAIGRCAVDPEHKVWFLNDDERWEVSEDGKIRSCRWCGNHTQRFEEYTEVVHRTRWVDVAPADHCDDCDGTDANGMCQTCRALSNNPSPVKDCGCPGGPSKHTMDCRLRDPA
jgi:hypothetical protein